MQDLALEHPYTATALKNLISAATRTDATAFGLVLKVRDNDVLNWMYADASVLRSIAAQRGSVTFPFADNPRSSQTLRELALSLSEATPFLALMIRYKGKSISATSWEFVDLAFIKSLTA
jgi:hypothetical protein